MKSLRVLMAALLVIGLTSTLCAQGRLTGSLRGKVLDNEGNALPGVTVTVEGQALQGKIAYVTTETGAFRFPSLPPGIGYQLTLELPGFNTIVRKGLIVSVGKATAVTVTMAMATLEEEITVVGESPTVDVKTSKTAVNFSKSFIYNIPMARDLYDVLNSIPGSLSEGVTYRRTSYIAGGTVRGNQYSLDGVTINDPVVMYPMTNINIDVYEEVEFGLGGHPAEVGIADGGYVNIVTRSGGNEFHGAATVEYYNEDMQKSLLSEEDLKAVGLTKPFGWNTWQDFSLSVGGPIIKDRVWVFTNGRYFKWERDFNHVIWDDTVAAGERVYTLDVAPHNEWDLFGKLTFQLAPNIRFMTTYNLALIDEFFYTFYNYLDVTATSRWDHEKGHTISSQLNWVFSQNLFIDLRVGYISRLFPILYNDYAISDAPQLYDRYYEIYRNNPSKNEIYLRHRLNPSLVATFFQDALLGASHEIKIGFEYEVAYASHDGWRENPWIMRTYQGSPYSYATASYPNRGFIICQAWPSTEGGAVIKQKTTHWGAFVQDSVTIKDRLTLNLGARFDSSTGKFPEQHHSATPDPYGVIHAGPVLKGTSIAWDDYTFDEMTCLTWNHISPRIGFSYDLFGDGKTSIRGSWSRYNEYLMIQYYALANPAGARSGYWFWFDDNPNLQVDPADSFFNIYMPPDPFAYVLEEQLDTDASAPYTNEFTLGVEREMAKDFSVSLNFMYKHKTNIFEDVNDFGLGKDEAWKGYRADSPYWEKFEFNDPGDDGEFGTDDDKTSYCYAHLADAPDIHYYLTNVDGGYRKYMALQLILNKRMSKGWQLLGSLTWSKAWGNIGGSYGQSFGMSSRFDTPNSYIYSDGRLDYDRPLNIKLQSTVILPLDIILSGYLNHVSGDPWSRTVTVTYSDDPKWKVPAGVWTVPSEEYGTRRNPPVTTLDLRIEKRFRLGEFGTIGGYIDIINALGRSGYMIDSDPGGYLDYSDPANPAFTRYGNYGDITDAYGNRVVKVSLRFTF